MRCPAKRLLRSARRQEKSFPNPADIAEEDVLFIVNEVSFVPVHVRVLLIRCCLYKQVFNNMSPISNLSPRSWNDGTLPMRIVRWRKDRPLSRTNAVLLTHKESRNHLIKHERPEDQYLDDLVRIVDQRLAIQRPASE